MATTESIFKGDTAGPWEVAHIVDGAPRLLTIDDTCIIKVSGTTIERAVTQRTPDNFYFRPALLPAETATLVAGQSYVVVVQIDNLTLTPVLSKEEHIILAVKADGGSTGSLAPPTELERLKAHREALLDAKEEAIGGTTVMVRNGRFGNEMRMQSMTYDQICLALERNRQEIATEERIAAGGSRRGGVAIAWAH